MLLGIKKCRIHLFGNERVNEEQQEVLYAELVYKSRSCLLTQKVSDSVRTFIEHCQKSDIQARPILIWHRYPVCVTICTHCPTRWINFRRWIKYSVQWLLTSNIAIEPELITQIEWWQNLDWNRGMPKPGFEKRPTYFQDKLTKSWSPAPSFVFIKHSQELFFSPRFCEFKSITTSSLAKPYDLANL